MRRQQIENYPQLVRIIDRKLAVIGMIIPMQISLLIILLQAVAFGDIILAEFFFFNLLTSLSH